MLLIILTFEHLLGRISYCYKRLFQRLLSRPVHLFGAFEEGQKQKGGFQKASGGLKRSLSRLQGHSENIQGVVRDIERTKENQKGI